jgi:thiosulfate dehydrogenase [quinone] large subunit
MSYRADTAVPGLDTSLELSGPWTGYWLAMVRMVTGFWFFHAGLTKLLFGFDASGYLQFASAGTVFEPVMQPFASGAGLAVVNFAIPAGEFLIGLGLLVGGLVRLASFFGALLMTFFWTTNAGWSHGMVSGDLMGLLLFGTIAMVGAGRFWGIDAYLEDTDIVQRNRWLQYLLG